MDKTVRRRKISRMVGGKSAQTAAETPDEANGFPGAGRKKNPEWAKGLKQFYDSVVDEPLPDSFADLLSRLDDEPSK